MASYPRLIFSLAAIASLISRITRRKSWVMRSNIVKQSRIRRSFRFIFLCYFLLSSYLQRRKRLRDSLAVEFLILSLTHSILGISPRASKTFALVAVSDFKKDLSKQ